MMTRRLKAGAMIILTAVSVLQAAETAAVTENVWDMSLEELMNVDVRTAATLTEVNPHKSPSSVTVITAEDIAVTPARNILDLMEIYVPGAIYMNHSIGPVFGIRGNLVDRPYQYLITVNGINVNIKAHYGARLELLNWDLNDIQRIEIIRGPGSVTYGPGAVGGVINIVTKKAADAPGVGVGGFFWDKYDSFGQYASYGHTSEKFDAFAYVSTVSTNGVEPDLFAVNATRAGYLGHTNAPSYPAPPATYMSDYFDEPQIKAHVDLDFKNGWRFWARYVTSSTSLVQSSALQYQIEGKYQDYRQTRHRYMEYALENLTPVTDDLDFKSLFSFGSNDTQDIQKFTTSPALGTSNKLRNAGWMWSENTFFTRFMLDYHPDTFIKAAAGVEYSYDDFGPAWGKGRDNGLRMGTNIISGTNSDAYGTGSNQVPGSVGGTYYAVGHGWNTSSHAVFGETNVQVADQHSMLLSARVDKHSYTDYMFSPRAAWIYEFQKKQYLKFIAQRSVRMNTADQLYVNHQRDMDNEPEKLDSFELMYDGQWNDNFSTTVSMFSNKNAIIAWDGTGSSPLGTLRTLGIEWEGKYKTDNFDFGANHSYVKQQYWHLADGISYSGISYSEYERTAGGITIMSNGNDLANWPNQATKLFSNIHFLEKKMTLHGDIRMLWGFEGANDGLDALDDAGGSSLGINAARHHDAYDPEITANVSLTYRFNPSADLTFFVQNIPVMGDNKRYSYSSGHNNSNANKTSWVEEPTVVGFRYHVRF